MHRFTQIAWDFDGTLYCSYPYVVDSLSKALAKYGVSVNEEELLAQVRVTVRHAVCTYAPLCGCTPDELSELYHKYASVYSDTVLPFEGIPELLKDLTAAGIQNHICSNRSTVQCRMYLQTNGLDQYFVDYAGPDLGLENKPKPDLVTYLVDRHGKSPEAFLMVGDRDLDIIAAHAAGVAGCFFDPDKFYTAPESAPEFIAPDIAALRSLLLG